MLPERAMEADDAEVSQQRAYDLTGRRDLPFTVIEPNGNHEHQVIALEYSNRQDDDEQHWFDHYTEMHGRRGRREWCWCGASRMHTNRYGTGDWSDPRDKLDEKLADGTNG